MVHQSICFCRRAMYMTGATGKCGREGRVWFPKELKVWDPSRTDVRAPSTNPSMTRLIPAMVASHPEEGRCLWGIDIKDAFLSVEQRSELYILLH